MSFRDTSNVRLSSVTVAGRTLTPNGAVRIGDIRLRLPVAGGSVTLAGSTEAAAFDVYAQSVGGDAYRLIVLAQGTTIAGRVDVIPVGTAVDYPSRGLVQFLPLPGSALDAYIYVDGSGVHIRPFAVQAFAQLILDDTNFPPGFMGQFFAAAGGTGATLQSQGTLVLQGGNILQLYGSNGALLYLNGTGFIMMPFAGAAGETITVEKFGRIRHTQSPTSPSVSLNATAGTGATAQVIGTDSYGRIELTTGTATSGGSNPLLTVTYLNPLPVRPYGVSIAPANANALGMSNNQIVGVPYAPSTVTVNGFTAYVGQQALSASTLYIFNYLVLIA
jgi:hypothetical protein